MQNFRKNAHSNHYHSLIWGWESVLHLNYRIIIFFQFYENGAFNYILKMTAKIIYIANRS